jgi:hypothetical protein
MHFTGVLGGTAALHSHSTVGGCTFFTLKLPGETGSGRGARAGVAKFGFVPAAEGATPGTEAFADEEDDPNDGPETAGEESEEEMAAIGDAGVDEEALRPAMGTISGKSLAPGPVAFALFSLGAFHAVRGWLTQRAECVNKPNGYYAKLHICHRKHFFRENV